MYENLAQHFSKTALSSWAEQISKLCIVRHSSLKNGDYERWQQAIDSLPNLRSQSFSIDNGTLSIGSLENVSKEEQEQINKNLRILHPWRKGPYSIYGITIDTEWQSYKKWDRLKEYIQSLEKRLVLDVGCGNGYYCWHMRNDGARLVIGIDPFWLYVMQFHMIHTFTSEKQIFVLPLGLEEMPGNMHCFDTVFSMGILYHHRSPFDHLLKLKAFLRPGGELVLETLVIEGHYMEVLVPEDRYAKMRNVWFIPATNTLLSWLKRCSFRNIRLIDVSRTTTEEQRSTDWMRFESLSDFLDEHNPNKTVEGHPAPVRAIFLAENPP